MVPETNPGKKARSNSARSRGGCNTCKIRRVKCGEEKPGCLRCKRFGRPCDGYEVTSSSKPRRNGPFKATARTSRNLLPNTLALAPSLSRSRVPISIKFTDAAEERYFHLFNHETAAALSGGFEHPLWNRILLQACHTEECILHCTIAIAALDRAHKVRNTKLSHTYSHHRRYALRYYAKAIQGVQVAVSTHKNPLRTALMASLLIFCFESFLGDVRRALTKVQSAVNYMHGWLISNTSEKAKPKSFSPAPNVIEDELVAAFARLDVHLMSWTDTPAPARVSVLESHLVTEVEPLPAFFTSLMEAKYHFEHVVNRIFQYLSVVEQTKYQHAAATTSNGTGPTTPPLKPSNISQLIANPGAQNAAGWILASNPVRHGSQDSPPSAVELELQGWLQAFTPILAQSRLPSYTKTFIGSAQLRIHALTLSISLRSALFPTNTPADYDVFLPEYCEIVALCKESVEHECFVKSFVFDAGIVPSLFVVVTKCRDRALRQEAIRILRSAGSRREGVWDARMVASIGVELMRVEDEQASKADSSRGSSPSGSADEERHSEGSISRREKRALGWVEVHLQCLSTSFELPNVGTTDGEVREHGRGYLLDWVERCAGMKDVDD